MVFTFSKTFSRGVGFLSFNFIKLAGVHYIIWKKYYSIFYFWIFFKVRRIGGRVAIYRKGRSPPEPTRLSLHKTLAPVPKQFLSLHKIPLTVHFIEEGKQMQQNKSSVHLTFFSFCGKKTPSVCTMLLRANDVPPRPKIQVETSATVPFTPGLLVPLFSHLPNGHVKLLLHKDKVLFLKPRKYQRNIPIRTHASHWVISVS